VKAHQKFDDPEWDGDPGDIIVDGPKEPKPKKTAEEPNEPPKPRDPADPDGPSDKPEMVQIELARGHIINIAATTFWGPDGKPISAKDFIERMFGELPKLFKDEDELRKLWGNPDTRKALLEQLADRGYDSTVLKQIRQAIMAEDSDLFDVLAHIAYATEPKTRQERAEAGALAIKGNYDAKLASFLAFVLGQYVEAGAEGLDRSNLPVFLQLKYGNPVDGAKALGGVERVSGSFVGFQKHLYT
jgi:type I restriction enzyme R subunit